MLLLFQFFLNLLSLSFPVKLIKFPFDAMSQEKNIFFLFYDMLDLECNYGAEKAREICWEIFCWNNSELEIDVILNVMKSKEWVYHVMISKTYHWMVQKWFSLQDWARRWRRKIRESCCHDTMLIENHVDGGKGNWESDYNDIWFFFLLLSLSFQNRKYVPRKTSFQWTTKEE